MKILKLLATCIHICIKTKNNILKDLLYSFAKDHIEKNKMIFLYIKIASMNEKSEFYKIMKKWIVTHQAKIIRQLLYYKL